MAYNPTKWINGVTKLNAPNLNNIEDGIAGNTTVNAYQSLEITSLRMELVLTQLNSIGFYDIPSSILFKCSAST